MIAILDTSILVRDFSQRSAPFQVLLGALQVLEDFRILVPEVVLDETAAKFREHLAEEYERERHATEKLARLLGTPRTPLPQPLELTSETLYRTTLRSRLSNAGCEFAPYPDVAHKAIVTRELSRKAPFSAKGGYRDYLIWLTALNCAREHGDEVILITANTHDFCQGDEIHPDLKADLTNGESVQVANALDAFNTRYLRPRMDVVSGMSEAVSGGSLTAEVETQIEALLDEAADDIELDFVAGFDDEKGRARLRRVRISHVGAGEAVHLAEGKVWVEFDAKGNVNLDITTRTQDFAERHDAIRAFSPGTEPGEWNWDEDHSFEAHGSLIIDPQSVAITGAGIDKVEIEGIEFRVDQGIARPW